MTEPTLPPLPKSAVLRYAMGGMGQSMLPMLVTVWLLAFYTEPEHAFLLSAGVLGTIRMIERIIGAGLEPLVGHLSDRTRTRFGRRRPWMAVGLPLLCLSFIGLWSPPSANGLDDPITIVWVSACLMIFFASYTAVYAPYNALLPQMHPSTTERVRLSVWMSLFEVIGQIAASVGGAPLIGLGAMVVIGVSIANGFVVLAIVSAAVTFVTMAFVIARTTEPPPSPTEVSLPFFVSVRTLLADPNFVRYGGGILGFRMATNLVLVAVPFVGGKLMGLTPGETSLIPAVIIIVAVLAFPLVQWLADRHGKPTVFRWGGLGFIIVLPLTGTIGLGGLDPQIVGGALFALSGLFAATLFVLPRALLADIIDADAGRHGARREALYTGMSGVVEKLGEAFAMGLSAYVLVWFGQGTESFLGIRLLGVAASLSLVVGMLVFRRYDLRPLS